MVKVAGFLSPDGVGTQIGVTGARVRELIKSGHIQAIQPGGRRGRFLIPEGEVERLMQPYTPPEESK